MLAEAGSVVRVSRRRPVSLTLCGGVLRNSGSVSKRKSSDGSPEERGKASQPQRRQAAGGFRSNFFSICCRRPSRTSILIFNAISLLAVLPPGCGGGDFGIPGTGERPVEFQFACRASVLAAGRSRNAFLCEARRYSPSAQPEARRYPPSTLREAQRYPLSALREARSDPFSWWRRFPSFQPLYYVSLCAASTVRSRTGMDRQECLSY